MELVLAWESVGFLLFFEQLEHINNLSNELHNCSEDLHGRKRQIVSTDVACVFQKLPVLRGIPQGAIAKLGQVIACKSFDLLPHQRVQQTEVCLWSIELLKQFNTDVELHIVLFDSNRCQGLY